ncbi:MAG: B12-binding domain-containing radical SAM protein, partial [Bacteroidetes bacterium]
MNILFVYPQYPDTFWSFKHALKFISKKAGNPPLGLLTVAAMVPRQWEKLFIDLNVEELHDKDIQWADYVFLSGMSIQAESARKIISRCKAFGKKIVAGGPLFTARYDEFDEVDYLVLNEAEITLPLFLNDLSRGEAKHIYSSNEWADITTTPVPLWELIDFKQYATMNIQYSRGCPYDCEFCDITVLYGRKPRTKTADQLVGELESLYTAGWRGHVFLVDDNFIGNKGKVKKEILPALGQWMKKRKHVFSLSTEASLNLADDEELLHGMVEVGFNTV